MNKILLIGAQHGNELLGERLYDYIKKTRPELRSNVRYVTGNVRARKLGIRYNESDLNRSYNGKSATYEERRAARILRYIQQEDFDLVLDLHTTTCQQPPCFIVPQLTPMNAKYINSSSIEYIVEMTHEIVRTSLIGVCPVAISIEVNREEVDDVLLENLCEDLTRYLQKNTVDKFNKIYTIDALLSKDEVTENDVELLQNFQKSSSGFYPVLVGENSYKMQTNYLGFKAYKVRTSRV